MDGCEILRLLKTVVNIPLFLGFQPFAHPFGGAGILPLTALLQQPRESFFWTSPLVKNLYTHKCGVLFEPHRVTY